MQKSNLRQRIENINLSKLVYIILLSLPLYLLKFSIFNIPTTALEIEIYTAFIVFAGISFARNNFKNHLKYFIKNPFFIPWLLFFFAGIIAVFVSPDKKASLGILKAYFFDSGLFFFMLCSIIKNKEEIKNCYKSLMVSALILCVIGLSQYLIFTNMLQDGRIRSVFSSPNYLALYITPIYFLSLAFIKKPINKNIIPYIFSCIIVLGIIFTYSRGAWLGLALGFVFISIYIISLKTNPKIKIFVPLLFLIGFLVSSLIIIRGSYSLGLVPNSRVEQSDNIRKEIWATSIDIGLKHKWIGVGLGNFQDYFSEYTKGRINYPEYITPNAVTPHNIFLNIWLQTGALGLLAILWVLVLFFRICLNGLRKDSAANLIIIAAMISILGQGLVDSAIWKNDLILFFWFLVGISYIINNRGENHGK